MNQLTNDNVTDTETSQKFYDQGIASEEAGNRLAAIESYEAAFTANPDDEDICFRLAYNLDLLGEEDEALHLYEQAAQTPNPSLNALLNLAIMYEDKGKFAQAERCVRQVLTTDANHPRAKLYMKDILASKEMVIDDEAEKQTKKHNALLDTPVTDFDLSVRTRNCLRKMTIRTLGDLLRIPESELRSYKNLGDASLDEIRAMLAQRGLRLGQNAQQALNNAKNEIYEQLAGEGADIEQLKRSVNELQLSVRARKALALLNIQTMGDLCMRTEAELMGVKNFGMTSLVEIREKLIEQGLNLRKLDS